MDNFFYNLNDKLNSIREKPETTHKQLNERDMSRAAKGYEKYGKEGMEALAKAGREGKSLDPIRAKYDKYKDSVEEASGDYSAKKARAGKDIGKPGKNFEKIAKGAAERYGSKAAGERVAGAVLNKLRHPKEDVEEDALGSIVKKMGGAAKKVGSSALNKLGHGDDAEMMRNLQKKMGVPPTGKKPDVKEGDFGPMEGGTPMTSKQKSFAKLAPPADKITFADKIAGAKKEVDEMLGDVAAEAMKNALSGGQKKLDKNHNGKLDANDFAMLRKGGKKQVADEGWDEMEKDVKSRMSARKVGDITHGDKHDTQEIPGGRRVTRRTDPNTGYSVGADSDAPADGEKRGRGRPKGADKGPERVTSKATKHKGGRKTNEGDLDITDRGEYDQEGEMAKDDIKTIVRHAQALEKILGDNDNLPEWVQAKLAKIEGMMTAVDDYMQNQEDDEEMAVGEEKTSTRDNRAEKAGKKVTKDIEYDEKKKDGIHGKKRGPEDAKAEKAGKKVAKDIEYDEKKDKPKKVKEAGGTDTPTASSGFGFGQGIYDSMNYKLESMISESMSINVSSDSNGQKNITVTASDEDALKLATILKSAGLGVEGYGGSGYQSACGCGQPNCSCGDESMDEAAPVVSDNTPDWPTDQETAQDNFEYSGGLNKPKSTGQTTIPVIASQEDRQGTYAEAEEDVIKRMMEMAGIKKKEVDEEKTEEGNLFTKGLADNDIKIGEKIPGTNAVKKKDIDEGILASTANLWKEYKGQYGV
jgi:hypothetical protein